MRFACIAIVGAVVLAAPAIAAPITGGATVAPRAGTSYSVRNTDDDQEPGRLGARVGGKAGSRFGGRLNKSVNEDPDPIDVPPDFRDPWASLEYRLNRFDKPQ